MLIEIIVSALIATFIGVAIIGHILVFQAIFAKADDASGKVQTTPSHGTLSRA